MSKLRLTSVLAARFVPVSLFTLAVTCALNVAPARTAAQDVCDRNGVTDLKTDVPQATVEATFAAAGKTFAGVGDTATLLVTQEAGHQVFLTVVVLEETSPGFFTLRETISVTGCFAAPILSHSGLIALVLLLAIAGTWLLGSSRHITAS